MSTTTTGLLEKIGQALIAAAGCGSDLECGGYGNVLGRTTAVSPDERLVAVELHGMGPWSYRLELRLKLEPKLEIRELGRDEPAPAGWQLFADPLVPSHWDGFTPQPYAVRAGVEASVEYRVIDSRPR